jgi:hypothetical protein
MLLCFFSIIGYLSRELDSNQRPSVCFQTDALAAKLSRVMLVLDNSKFMEISQRSPFVVIHIKSPFMIRLSLKQYGPGAGFWYLQIMLVSSLCFPWPECPRSYFAGIFYIRIIRVKGNHIVIISLYDNRYQIARMIVKKSVVI